MKTAIAASLAFAIAQLTRPTGIDFVHRNSPTSHKYLIETMGGGVALLDFNNDGLLDVFFVNGGKLIDGGKPPFQFARQDPQYWNRLYRQNRGGTFTDVTAASGLSRPGNDYGMGAAIGDYDNDGFADLYVTNYGRNALYRNNRDGTFADVTEQARVAGGGWSVSAAFLDYDKDGRLDLFVARYLDYDLTRNILCGTPFHAYCRPDKYNGTTNLLFRNEGGGRFSDVSASSGIANVTGKGMGVAVEDYDDDAFPDIFVSNDLMEQFLFHNVDGRKFEEVALPAGVALSDDGKPYSGMGAAFGDFDNDNRADLLVTNLAFEKWALYRNTGGGQFSYASAVTGLAGVVARNSGWGAGFQDFDNDGWKDILAAQSHVLDNVEKINPVLSYLEAPGLYRNVKAKFERVDLAGTTKIAGRGAAFGDVNNDGTIDAVIAVLGGPPVVVSGRSNGNHWLTLKLTGTSSNRDGAGAIARIGNQRVYATSSGSYLSASDQRVHFGLGSSAANVKLEIVWPGGKRQTLNDVAVDQILYVQEPRE